MATFVKIATTTVGAGGAGNIEFAAIPQIYRDLCIIVSARSTGGFIGNIVDSVVATLYNNSTVGGFTTKRLYGNGSSVVPDTTASIGVFAAGSSTTANTFGGGTIYIYDYTSSGNKYLSINGGHENNTNASYISFAGQLQTLTAPVNKINLTMESGSNFVQNSVATLYGIK